VAGSPHYRGAMRWEDREQSTNVEDRRGGDGGLVPVQLKGAAGLIVVIVGLLMGFDPNQIERALHTQVPGRAAAHRVADPGEERLASFTKVILRDTEVVWGDLFRRMGREYRAPVLVLFSDRVDSACGSAQSAMGPFYCPGDARVYIDLTFYRDMVRSLNAPGEFARAYVIAHEVGHHVQTLLGYTTQEHALAARLHHTANQASVQLELQADFLAGVWAHHGQERYHFLDPGDVDSALHAAFEIGDDRLQRKASGRVVPDSFTHGTSKQRVAAFTDGFRTGDVSRARMFLR